MVYIILALIITAADLIIKNRIYTADVSAFPRELCKGRIVIDRVSNPGIAMGVWEKEPARVKRLTTAVLIVISILFVPAMLSRKVSLLRKAGYAMILGGAACNVADRYIRGYVVDYIRFRMPKDKIKLTFNISDFAIFFGVVIAVIGEIIHR